MPRKTPVTANQNFWSKVERTETCWLWHGTRTPTGGHYGTGGYGKFSGNLAHRVAYEALRGPIPDGLTLDHLCRNTCCVNPDHLEPVTGQENSARHFASISTCKRGHDLSGPNVRLRVRRNGRTERVCRACDALRHRKPNEQKETAA